MSKTQNPGNNVTGDSKSDKQSLRRFALALWIIIPALVILLAFTVLVWLPDCKEHFDTVFTAIIGLIGTWVGTILAFYYTKENFDAASRSTEALLNKFTNTDEKLASTKVDKVMLRSGQFEPFVFDETVKLDELIKKYFSKYNRLPIFTKEEKPKYILHGSIVDRFLARANQDPNATLKDLLANAEYLAWAESFTCLKEDDSLKLAKRLMEQRSNPPKSICSDGFVTADGTASTKVLGWITNGIIAEHSKV